MTMTMGRNDSESTSAFAVTGMTRVRFHAPVGGGVSLRTRSHERCAGGGNGEAVELLAGMTVDGIDVAAVVVVVVAVTLEALVFTGTMVLLLLRLVGPVLMLVRESGLKPAVATPTRMSRRRAELIIITDRESN